MRLMTSYITDQQRATALEQATTSVRAWLAGDGEAADAIRDVTAAIVIYGVTHRQIAQMAGVTGMAIIRLLAPDYQYPQQPTAAARRVLDARAEALRTERHAADRYRDEVLEAIRAEALHRIDYLGDEESPVARELGVNRASIRNWQGK